MKKAKENDKVKVHYKGTLDDGTVFDSSEGRDPLEFTLGSGQIIQGFDDAVKGMEVNEKKKVHIASNDAYGQRRDDLIQEFPKTALPEDIKCEVGQKLITETEDGQKIPVYVTEVKDDTFIIDANHPLAGEDLNFELTLVEIA